MDVNPIKPIPVVQPPRKIEREREDANQKKDRREADETDLDDNENDTGIDTYA